MSSPGWTARLSAVFAKPVGELDWAALEAALGEAREDEDLDFKQTLCGNADGDRKDLAGDIAAMANRRGSLVLIGIREDNGVAAALTPVALSDPEEARMHQITAQLVAPYVDFSKMRDGATTRCWSRVKCARCESSPSSFIVVKLDSPR